MNKTEEKCDYCKSKIETTMKEIMKIDIYKEFPEVFERTKTDYNMWNRFRLGFFCPYCNNFIHVKDKLLFNSLEGINYG